MKKKNWTFTRLGVTIRDRKGGQFTSGKGRYNASYISPKRKCRDIEFV